MTKETAQEMEAKAARKRQIEEEDNADLEAGYTIVVPRLGTSLETLVNELLSMKENGIRGVARFNDKKFYSDTVTMDNAYLEVTGKTLSEIDEYQKALERRLAELNQEHTRQIPYLKEIYRKGGRIVLDEKHWKSWDAELQPSLVGPFRGSDLMWTLDLIECLKAKSIEDAETMFYNQGHTGTSGKRTLYLIAKYSEEGKLLADKISPIKHPRENVDELEIEANEE